MEDKIIRRGDLLHCDVGIRYLRLNSDHQELAYVLTDGETQVHRMDLPACWQRGTALQKVFMNEFKLGLKEMSFWPIFWLRPACRASQIPESTRTR